MVAPEMLVHSGPARVFDSEESAYQNAITQQPHQAGDVVVIRYEGRWASWYAQMLKSTSRWRV